MSPLKSFRKYHFSNKMKEYTILKKKEINFMGHVVFWIRR